MIHRSSSLGDVFLVQACGEHSLLYNKMFNERHEEAKKCDKRKNFWNVILVATTDNSISANSGHIFTQTKIQQLEQGDIENPNLLNIYSSCALEVSVNVLFETRRRKGA